MQPDQREKADRIFRRYLERPRRRRLARLVDAYYRFVWDTALRVTGNAADAADIAQDVFLKLLLHPPRAEQVNSPHGYLAWEVVGRAARLRRAAGRRLAREKAAAGRAGEDGLSAADLDELRTRVQELPDELRAAVELRYFAGLRIGDIAALTGVGARHVEKRLERARSLLRSRLGPVTPLVLLLDGGAVDGSPIGPTEEPPAELRAELLKITAAGAALAAPAARAAASAGGTALAKHGVAAAVVAALFLLAGGAPAFLWSTRTRPGDRSVPAVPRVAASALAPGIPVPPADPAPAAAGSVTGAAYGSVRGAVYSEEGERLAGVLVKLRAAIPGEEAEKLREAGFPEATGGRLEREVLTGETGEYAFERLLPVEVTLDVEKSSYLPNWLPRARIKPGEDLERDVILCLPSRLYGTVRTPEGEAVKGAQLFINFDHAKHYFADPADPEPVLEHAFAADDEGRFDTGFGIVNIRHFCSLPGYVLAPGREMKKFNVSCRDFREREARLDLVLAGERRLTVLVKETSGAPVAGAAVRASSLAIHNVVTDAGGRAVLDRLPAGASGISVSKEGYQSELLDTVAPGSSEVAVVLQPLGPGIEGRITFDDGLPGANRQVDEVFFYELDDQDRVVQRINEVAHDEKRLRFTYHPRGPLRFEANCRLGSRTLTRKPLVYDGKNKLRVDFHLRLEPPFISGRVVRAGSREPLAGALVTLRLPPRARGTEPYWENYEFLNNVSFPLLPGKAATTRAAADGSFLFLLSPTDRYQPESPLRAHAILTAGSDELGHSGDLEFDLDIAAGTTVKDLELEVHRSGAIEGQVVDEAGEPLAAALVAAYDGCHVVKHAKAGPTAAYRIEGLRPGDYLLQFLGRGPYAVVGGGGGGVDAEGLPRPSELFERPVRVEAGRTSHWDVDLRRQGGLGAIDGVVPAELVGATGAECALLLGDRPRAGSSFGRHDDIRDGRFRLEPLRPGSYRVWLTGEGGGLLSEADVEVKPGPGTIIVMPVPAGALVIPLAGAPAERLSGARVVRLVRREAYLAHDAPVEREIAASEVTIAEGRVRLNGIAGGSVQATLLVPGFEAVRTGPVWVTPGSETVAPALELVAGHSVRVRLQVDEGCRLPGDPGFRVIEPRTAAEVPVTAARRGEEPVWELSGLPAGAFTVQVHAGAGFRPAAADVAAGQGQDAEVMIRLELRRS